MSLEFFFERIPTHEVEKISQALEHTSGSLRVQFVNTQQMVLDELVHHEVISRCERTGGYSRGINFQLLQEYANSLT